MRGVLIDKDQAVGAFGDYIGLGDLSARDAERVIGRFRRGRVCGLGARLRRWREESAAVVEGVGALIEG